MAMAGVSLPAWLAAPLPQCFQTHTWRMRPRRQKGHAGDIGALLRKLSRAPHGLAERDRSQTRRKVTQRHTPALSHSSLRACLASVAAPRLAYALPVLSPQPERA
jgi:hypothetical protein